VLGTKAYTQQYVDQCRARVEADLSAYRSLPGPVPEAFESRFFADLVLLLDYFFIHRVRMVEGKNGNPANEVRILCNSILNNNGVLTSENVNDSSAFTGLTSIKLSPEHSVLKYHAGDTVRLTEADFVRLSTAYFEEIERKFV
jgi:hypothetical protein